MLNESFIFTNKNFKNIEEVIQYVGKKMYEERYVKETYVRSVIEREKNLPTGIQISHEESVSIPHTDSEHVNETVVAIVSLEKPIEVYSMIDPKEKLQTELVFVLAVAKNDNYMEMLSDLMAFLQDQEKLKTLKNAQKKEDILAILAR